MLIIDILAICGSSGTFSDGSPAGANYDPQTRCSWLIQPTSSVEVPALPVQAGGYGPIELEFQAFQLADALDRVLIYNGMVENESALLVSLSGAHLMCSVSITRQPSVIDGCVLRVPLFWHWHSALCWPTDTTVLQAECMRAALRQRFIADMHSGSLAVLSTRRVIDNMIGVGTLRWDPANDSILTWVLG